MKPLRIFWRICPCQSCWRRRNPQHQIALAMHSIGPFLDRVEVNTATILDNADKIMADADEIVADAYHAWTGVDLRKKSP